MPDITRPRLTDVCTRCTRPYGEHAYGSSLCPTGLLMWHATDTFIAAVEPVRYDRPPTFDARCVSCGFRFGSHYGRAEDGWDCPVSEGGVRDTSATRTYWVPEGADASDPYSAAVAASRAGIAAAVARLTATPYVPRPLGYEYGGETHCIVHAQRAYPGGGREGVNLDACGIPLDAEGVTRIVGTESAPLQDISCYDCGYVIREGIRCSCGDGCDRGDCEACGDYDDDDRDEDDGFDSDGCRCPDCIAASEYRGEVS